MTLQGTPWLIPKTWIDRWGALLGSVPIADDLPTGAITIDHLLRYGPLDEHCVACLIADIGSGKVKPVGRCRSLSGIPSLALLRHEVHDRYGHPSSELMTVAAAADALGVKQEVAYALVRLGLLDSEAAPIGRRNAQGIRASALSKFRATYVLATELAKRSGRAPRAVISALASDGVEAVASPELGTCRQVIYRREDLLNTSWLQR